MIRPLLFAIGAALAVGGTPADAGNGETRDQFAGCATPDRLLTIEPALRHVAARLDNHEKLTIVAFGSSSTEGIGASSPRSTYPNRLEAELRRRLPQSEIRVINRGKRGEDALEEAARLDRDVIAERPDLVIWQFGTNAVLRRDDLAADRDAVLRGVARLRQSASDVVLMDVQDAPRVVARPAYLKMQQLIAETARQAGIGLFRRFDIMRHWHAEQRAGDPPTVGADGLHMTDRSYACLAAALAEGIVMNWREQQRDEPHPLVANAAFSSAPVGLVGDNH
jgi:lysophospholipase L1-like esterase